uniref:ANK_REP_REGION domain-containing protein n=1 Tax=Macrostomum lignano TaxID=282301 RepID=A0A1I8IJ07_9PLAT
MQHSLHSFNAPQPPAFLDPLYSLEDCYYYSVPRFLDALHPTNRWLIGRIKCDDSDAIRRKLEVSPDFLRGKYFQVLDNPALYFQDKKAGSPMYHCKCVLYLTALGVALYMKARDVTETLLIQEDPYKDRVTAPTEVQFASHIQNANEGDFHAFPLFLVALRREFFAAMLPLQAAGWQPNTELALPLRRRYERRAFYFRDWLDIALHMLASKSFYPVHLLIESIIGAPSYRSSQLPLRLFKPGPKDPAPTPTGLVDAESLPPGLRMTGAPNLLEVAEQYDRYLQLKQTLHAVQQLKRQAECDGLNPELLMQAAQDHLPEPLDTQPAENSNRNNNAKSQAAQPVRKSKLTRDPDRIYCSEPLRILLYSLERDPQRKSLPQCIQAFNVYLRRKFFFDAEQLASGHPRARDLRNTATCLLNMARREQDIIENILARVRSGQCRFAHVKEHKVLDSRRLQHVATIDRLVDCLAHVLLQGKQLLTFLRVSQRRLPFPPSSVDFQPAPRTSLILSGVRYGLVRAFNATRTAWRYLTVDMMRKAAKDPSLVLHCRFGQRPSRDEVLAYDAEMKKLKKQKSSKKHLREHCPWLLGRSLSLRQPPPDFLHTQPQLLVRLRGSLRRRRFGSGRSVGHWTEALTGFEPGLQLGLQAFDEALIDVGVLGQLCWTIPVTAQFSRFTQPQFRSLAVCVACRRNSSMPSIEPERISCDRDGLADRIQYASAGQFQYLAGLALGPLAAFVAAAVAAFALPEAPAAAMVNRRQRGTSWTHHRTLAVIVLLRVVAHQLLDGVNHSRRQSAGRSESGGCLTAGGSIVGVAESATQRQQLADQHAAAAAQSPLLLGEIFAGAHRHLLVDAADLQLLSQLGRSVALHLPPGSAHSAKGEEHPISRDQSVSQPPAAGSHSAELCSPVGTPSGTPFCAGAAAAASADVAGASAWSFGPSCHRAGDRPDVAAAAACRTFDDLANCWLPAASCVDETHIVTILDLLDSAAGTKPVLGTAVPGGGGPVHSKAVDAVSQNDARPGQRVEVDARQQVPVSNDGEPIRCQARGRSGFLALSSIICEITDSSICRSNQTFNSPLQATAASSRRRLRRSGPDISNCLMDNTVFPARCLSCCSLAVHLTYAFVRNTARLHLIEPAAKRFANCIPCLRLNWRKLSVSQLNASALLFRRVNAATIGDPLLFIKAGAAFAERDPGHSDAAELEICLRSPTDTLLSHQRLIQALVFAALVALLVCQTEADPAKKRFSAPQAFDWKKRSTEVSGFKLLWGFAPDAWQLNSSAKLTFFPLFFLSSRKRFSAPQAFDWRKRFSAPQAFDWRKRFSAPQAFDWKKRFSAPRPTIGSAGLTLMKSEQPGAESRGQTDGLDDASNINIGPDHKTHVRDDKK